MIRQVPEDNYRASRQYIGRVQTQEQYDQTHAFTDDFLQRHVDWLRQRQIEGYIRECHGDLHLNNVCWIDGKPLVFDCIEFNEAFRNIDTSYDIAFMFMELCFRERPDLAYSFLNAYLETSGDYRGVALLPLYGSMRAYVRAKIDSWCMDDMHLSRAARRRAAQRARGYYRLAWEFTRPRQGQIVAMSGLSGSGKTTLARYLAEQVQAIHIRSDAIRKQLGGIPLEQRGTAELYTPQVTARTYARLLELGIFLARQGQTVILDAKYDRRALRAALIKEAASNGIPLHILGCEAPVPLLVERLASREADISDATPDLVAAQVAADEPYLPEEEAYVVHIDTTADWARQLSELAHRMKTEVAGGIPANAPA